MLNLTCSTSTQIREFTGNNSGVHRVIFLDDRSFVSGHQDGIILLWNRTLEGPTRILQGHTKSINQLIRHDNLLISGAFDNTIRIWDLSSGDCIHVLEGHSSYISSLMMSADSSLLHAGCGNGEVRMWNWNEEYENTTSNT